jgi:signal peptidase I
MEDATPKPVLRPFKPVAVWLAALLVLLGGLVLAGVLPFTRGLYLWPPLWIAGSLLIGVTRMPAGAALGASGILGAGLLGLLVAVNFKAVKVQGNSMQPTLQPGDVLLVDLTEQPDTRQGIYVLDLADENHAHLIKRLVGLPGEAMEVRYGRVFADDVEVYPRDGTPQDTWYEERPAHARYFDGPRDNGDGYFVIGDNPPVSRDSRHFGVLKRSDFEGRVVWSLRGSRGFGPAE